MFDPDAPPRHPSIAAALGHVRRALAAAGARRLLIACSGGADSVAALGLLVLLRRSEGLELAVGHVDHGLRPEARADAEQVRALARRCALPFECTRLELADGPGLPARARTARYVALAGQAAKLDVEILVLAHTATDQAETMFMNLARGCGLDGLAAMADAAELEAHGRPVLRPLLALTRAQTRELAERLELPFVDDPTNARRDSPRTWWRHEVLPRLRAQNPAVEGALLELARQARDAEEALEGWARSEAERRRQGPGWRLDGFHELPRAVRTRALRRICAAAGVDLAELRARTTAEIEAAATTVASCLAAGPGADRPAPAGWDLHPKKRLRVDKNGVFVGDRELASGTADL